MTTVLIVLLIVAVLAVLFAGGYLFERRLWNLSQRVETDEKLLVALDRKVDDLDVPAETALEPAEPEPAEEDAPVTVSTPIRRRARTAKRPELCAHCGRRPPNRSRHWSGAWLCKVCVRKGHGR
jgi:hypothetical protein